MFGSKCFLGGKNLESNDGIVGNGQKQKKERKRTKKGQKRTKKN